jgi:hypothetical protein
MKKNMNAQKYNRHGRGGGGGEWIGGTENEVVYEWT